jgi:hypothetical protein
MPGATEAELHELRRQLRVEIARVRVMLLLGDEATDAALLPRLARLRQDERAIGALLAARREAAARPVVDFLKWRTGCAAFG